MLRLAANLSTMFTEAPLEARFALAASAGFRAVELQFPYTLTPQYLACLLRDNGLELVLFNAPAGDVAAGERGLAIEGGTRFDAAIEQALAYANATDCRLVHVMVGNRTADGALNLLHLAEALKRAARRLAVHGANLMLEALNPYDQPNYALPSLAKAETLRLLVGETNVHLQFDAYHAARSGGDPIALLATHLAHVGHVQLADAADRGEPDSAQMKAFLAVLDASEYAGFVGCEYLPRGDTMAGLGWAARYGIGQSQVAGSGTRV